MIATIPNVIHEWIVDIGGIIGGIASLQRAGTGTAEGGE